LVHGVCCTTVTTLCLQVVVLVQGLVKEGREESTHRGEPREGRPGRGGREECGGREGAGRRVTNTSCTMSLHHLSKYEFQVPGGDHHPTLDRRRQARQGGHPHPGQGVGAGLRPAGQARPPRPPPARPHAPRLPPQRGARRHGGAFGACRHNPGPVPLVLA